MPASVRELFLLGIGARAGALAVADGRARAVRREPARSDAVPAAHPTRVDLVHGTDDDVIPFEQSYELAAKLVHADVRVHVTGLYDHTGSTLPSIPKLAREMRTMANMLRVLAR